MKRICLALVGLALISACKNKPEPAAAVAVEPGREQAAAQKWALTLPMIDGYLRYQRTLLVQAGKLPVQAWDGGLKAYEEPTVEQKASIDERARLEAGLSPEDVVKIEAMLSRVSARRMTSRLMKMDEKMPELPAPDPEDSSNGGDLAKELENHVKLGKSIAELPEEREAFGSRNIDVLLQREEELLKNWGLMMQVPELSAGKR